jgi:hypothetical protein
LQKSVSAIGGNHPAESAPWPFLFFKIQAALFVDAKSKHDPDKNGKEFVKI